MRTNMDNMFAYPQILEHAWRDWFIAGESRNIRDAEVLSKEDGTQT